MPPMKTAIYLFPFLLVAAHRADSAVISPGQTSTFSASADGWANGSAADPELVPNGGLAGAGDGFLRITSDGSGAGGRLTIFNRTEWAGDFSGVTGFTADFANLGSTPLVIRISLRSSTSGATGYVTSDSISLPADGVWRQASFSFSSLVGIAGPPALPGFLASVSEMRVFHAPLPDTTQGNTVTAQLGMDNLRAVPEPGTGLFLAGTAAGILLRRRKSR